MSFALTFLNKELLESTLVDADGAVHYMMRTSSVFILGRKATTITAATGLVGTINWRAKTFEINGVQRKWSAIKSKPGGLFSSSVLALPLQQIRS